MSDVSAYPEEFIADLRRLRPWSDFSASIWRNPDLVRLTYSALAQVVQAAVGSSRRNILYVGSGVGHIALELAHQGHNVIGLDMDDESVALARRAAESDPHRLERGNLSYEVAEFPSGGTTGAPYDAVPSAGSFTTSETRPRRLPKLRSYCAQVGTSFAWTSPTTSSATPRRIGWQGLGSGYTIRLLARARRWNSPGRSGESGRGMEG